MWPLGQAVKTPPFHGGNTGSNPVGVTIFFLHHFISVGCKKSQKQVVLGNDLEVLLLN